MVCGFKIGILLDGTLYFLLRIENFMYLRVCHIKSIFANKNRSMELNNFYYANGVLNFCQYLLHLPKAIRSKLSEAFLLVTQLGTGLCNKI